MKGARHLSDLPLAKINIECECGLTRRYDRRALMTKIGDADLPSLLREMAHAEGCERAKPVGLFGICQIGYGPEVVEVLTRQ